MAMESKFHLLGVGQHFEWEGKRYVKSTPLLATQVPEGGQKFMPRAALVRLVGEEISAPRADTPATLDSATVREAIERYHQRCLKLSVELQQGDAGATQDMLEQFYRELLAELQL